MNEKESAPMDLGVLFENWDDVNELYGIVWDRVMLAPRGEDTAAAEKLLDRLKFLRSHWGGGREIHANGIR